MGKRTQKITKKAKGIIEEFKVFAMRGNVVDMAVGVVMGTTFTKIVSSLVGDIIMPGIAFLVGSNDFSSLQYPINSEEAIRYGAFIQTIIDFLLVAVCMFVVIKMMSKLIRKKEQKPEPAPEPKKSDEAILLEEIRDLLKKD